MDLLKKLEPVDLFNIAKMAGVTKIYDKQIPQLMKEITERRSSELGIKVEDYFTKENISKSLLHHNQRITPLLNDTNCYVKSIRFNNPDDKRTKEATVIFDKKNAVKIFNYREKALFSEFIIYTYVIPFLFFSNMTFNILIPKATGNCKVAELTSKPVFKNATNNQKLDDTLFYINTPFLEKSLYDISYDNGHDIHYYTFQILYTLGAFGKIGLIHNDLHSNNIRITKANKKYPVKFTIDNTTSYNVEIEYMPLIYDFDYTGLDNPISGLLQKYGLPSHNFMDPSVCEHLSICNKADGGRRDTLLFLLRYMMTFYTPINYLNSRPKYSQNSVEYIKKITKHISGINVGRINNQNSFNKLVDRIKNTEQFQAWTNNYNDLLELIITITNGQVKKFFQSVKDEEYIPGNKEWVESFKNREGREPTSEDWIYDLIYRNKIPECPLPIPYTSETMMSTIEVLQSNHFKYFIGYSKSIDADLRPKYEVSINVTNDYIDTEYTRFMSEMFRV